MTRDDVTEMARLGVVASVQPAHLLDDRDVTELIWPDRADRCFPLRWMVDDGVQLAMGSDAPVSPLDPWLAIAAAVHRSPTTAPPGTPSRRSPRGRRWRRPSTARVRCTPGTRPTWCSSTPTRSTRPATPEDQAARLRAMPVAATWVAGRLVHGEASLVDPMSLVEPGERRASPCRDP